MPTDQKFYCNCFSNYDINKYPVIKTETESFMLGGESIEDVDSFVYLGSKVTKDGGAAQDVAQRIQKANGAFVQLYPNTLYITIIFCCKNIRSSQRF